MSKSILIIDTPNSCKDCPFFTGYYSDHCTVKGLDIYEYVYKKIKPEWCPLKPIPEKRTLYSGDPSVSAYEVRGYNRCISEILGE